MPRLSDTIARLNRIPGVATDETNGAARLRSLDAFGSNPGALTAWSYVPAKVEALPLVVVLHGCTQTAAGYDRGSGWSVLAERFGFAVVFAEQSRANNANGCFNWFLAADTQRGGGEALSIRQMIAAMVGRYPVDPARIYVTGLSAGGAMASVMLATYPEIFAGGAIIAGLPYGAASAMPQAFERMRGIGHVSDEVAAAAIMAASPHRGPWPSVSVWHGTADATVNVANADRIIGQWRIVQGLSERPNSDEQAAGHRHRSWIDARGAVRLEEYRIAGMGHGTPIRTDGATACGTAMPYMLEAGISSTWHIAKRWGLLAGQDYGVQAPRAAATATSRPLPQAFDVQATIEAALRQAGLLR